MRKVFQEFVKNSATWFVLFFALMTGWQAYQIGWDDGVASAVISIKGVAFGGGMLGIFVFSALRAANSRIATLESELADLKSKIEAKEVP